MHVTPLGWVVTLALIGGLLALDWIRHGRHPHKVEFGEAVRWSLFYITIAILFGAGLGVIAGWDLGIQYYSGYVVEKSLSVDNLFVFVIIISSFSVPAEQQPKVLTIGITIALALRAVFIALGAALLAAFSLTLLLFGLILVATAIQLYRHRDQDPVIEDNLLVRTARRVLPISATYDQGRIITRRRGHRALTPLALALVALGTTDLLFALDSIPAVFAVTDHPYIVFVANAFALLGLRALYFLVTDLLNRLVYLSTGLVAILGFVGIKLILEFAHQQQPSVPEIPIGLSLAVIAVILATTAIASLLKTRHDPHLRAHAGSLRDASGRSSPVEESRAESRA